MGCVIFFLFFFLLLTSLESRSVPQRVVCFCIPKTKSFCMILLFFFFVNHRDLIPEQFIEMPVSIHKNNSPPQCLVCCFFCFLFFAFFLISFLYSGILLFTITLKCVDLQTAFFFSLVMSISINILTHNHCSSTVRWKSKGRYRQKEIRNSRNMESIFLTPVLALHHKRLTEMQKVINCLSFITRFLSKIYHPKMNKSFIIMNP